MRTSRPSICRTSTSSFFIEAPYYLRNKMCWAAVESIAMKKLFLSCFVLLLASTVTKAESNWVNAFLARYQPAIQSPVAVQVQAGTLPLATQDIVRLLL